jgi:hypothetical protein
VAENKTQITDAPVDDFLAHVTPPLRADDARVLIDLMARLSGEAARMYGPSIIGFGRCRYRTDAGREGDMPRLCFSPRKAHLVFYGLRGGAKADLLPRRGKFKSEGGCIYVKTLADIDMAVLEKLLTGSLAANRLAYPA